MCIQHFSKLCLFFMSSIFKHQVFKNGISHSRSLIHLIIRKWKFRFEIIMKTTVFRVFVSVTIATEFFYIYFISIHFLPLFFMLKLEVRFTMFSSTVPETLETKFWVSLVDYVEAVNDNQQVNKYFLKQPHQTLMSGIRAYGINRLIKRRHMYSLHVHHRLIKNLYG